MGLGGMHSVQVNNNTKQPRVSWCGLLGQGGGKGTLGYLFWMLSSRGKHCRAFPDVIWGGGSFTCHAIPHSITNQKQIYGFWEIKSRGFWLCPLWETEELWALGTFISSLREVNPPSFSRGWAGAQATKGLIMPGLGHCSVSVRMFLGV